MLARKLWIALTLLIVLPLLGPAKAHAWDLKGKVLLTGKGDPEIDREADQIVVFYRPDEATDLPRPAGFKVHMKGKRFTPQLLVVPVGSTVSFPNEDPILHNVFSLTAGNEFDLGLYPKGPGEPTTFGEPGLVRVFCNVHHDMVSFIWVLDSPYRALVNPQGEFVLKNLPAGSGELVFWHRRADVQQLKVTEPTTDPIELQLELTKPKIPRHLNKEGRKYQRKRRGNYG